MKYVVSVSLGSSARNKKTETSLLGEDFVVERIGVDGDFGKYREKLCELDGKADAIGLGGIDLYLWTADRRYTIRDAKKLADCVKKSPVVDGSGIKNTIERKTIEYLNDKGIIDFSSSKAFMVCGLDRFGMSQTLDKVCKNVIYGDAMFALGINAKIKNYRTLCRLGGLLLPIFCNVPFKMLYPTGNKQSEHYEKYNDVYADSDIICGDYLFINKYLPGKESGALKDKTIITNTLTEKALDNLKERGISKVISTTPNFSGRNFGTNVFEGILTVILGRSIYEVQNSDINSILSELEWKPSIVYSKD
ncbi:MAG: quinate 5-dehydrogenase [Armatimonadetes bacterium]|nr:quinate 5-dehydrogenase [Candidatus Hippobium faecium]